MLRISLAKLHADLDASLAALRADPGAVVRSRAHVEAALTKGDAIYGVNTGFGALATKRIPNDQIAQLQRNLMLSHAVGVGPPIPKAITALMLKLKIHALGLGHSGVSLPTFERLLKFDELGLVPFVPSKGSVGASGDLAPLAHLCLPLLGEGEFWGVESAESSVLSPQKECLASSSLKTQNSALRTLKRHGLEPITLGAKDGLALINGTQLMSAYGAFILEQALRFVRLCDVAAALSLEALRGSGRPFDERIHAIRPHAGQVAVAGNLRRLLAASEIMESHKDCGKVQDPYSLRCVPQVHGASRDALAYAGGVVETEINGVTDNPLVFDDGDIVSGGNFHGQPLALALDFAAIALAELGSISERRTYLLLEGHDGLPKLLMKETGINSGFMIPQYTAAALVSENKVLCHPASVDSIPTSLGQEDHVSMGSIAATKLLTVFENVREILTIELLTAAQALDFRRPLRAGLGVEAAHRVLRQAVAHRTEDRLFQDDLSAVRACGDAMLRAIAAAGVELQ